jgi:hypothetical protein
VCGRPYGSLPSFTDLSAALTAADAPAPVRTWFEPEPNRLNRFGVVRFAVPPNSPNRTGVRFAVQTKCCLNRTEPNFGNANSSAALLVTAKLTYHRNILGPSSQTRMITSRSHRSWGALTFVCSPRVGWRTRRYCDLCVRHPNPLPAALSFQVIFTRHKLVIMKPPRADRRAHQRKRQRGLRVSE